MYLISRDRHKVYVCNYIIKLNDHFSYCDINVSDLTQTLVQGRWAYGNKKPVKNYLI